MSRPVMGLVMIMTVWGSGITSRDAYAQDGLKTVKMQIDGRTVNNRATEPSLQAITGLKSFDLVCLDIQVVMDGSQPNAALASTDNDTQRYPVACRADRMGEFPMASGVEYLLPNVGTIGQQSISVLLYPGSRTDYPFNSVDCIADPGKPKVAIFRVRGFYTVDTKNLGDNRQIELRAASAQSEPAINRSAAASCLQ